MIQDGCHWNALFNIYSHKNKSFSCNIPGNIFVILCIKLKIHQNKHYLVNKSVKYNALTPIWQVVTSTQCTVLLCPHCWHTFLHICKSLYNAHQYCGTCSSLCMTSHSHTARRWSKLWCCRWGLIRKVTTPHCLSFAILNLESQECPAFYLLIFF